MPDWLQFAAVFFLVVGVIIVRRSRAGGAFLGLLFGLGMTAWAAFAFSGGRLGHWIGAELAYWEQTVGSLAVGTVLVVVSFTVVQLLLWLARRLAARPRRPDTAAVVPGLDAPAGPGSDWDVFSGDSAGDFGAGDFGAGDFGAGDCGGGTD